MKPVRTVGVSKIKMFKRLFYIPFLVIAVVVLFAMGFYAHRSYQELAEQKVRTEEVQGTLSDTKIEEDTDGDGNKSYTTDATITFSVKGENYAEEVTLDGEHRDGDEHVVYYNPDDPADYSIYSAGDRKSQIVFAVIFCLGDLIVMAILVGKIAGVV